MTKKEARQKLKELGEFHHEHCKEVYFPARRLFLTCDMDFEEYMPIRKAHQNLLKEFDRLESILGY